jgi:hypothetical protein
MTTSGNSSNNNNPTNVDVKTLLLKYFGYINEYFAFITILIVSFSIVITWSASSILANHIGEQVSSYIVFNQISIEYIGFIVLAVPLFIILYSALMGYISSFALTEDSSNSKTVIRKYLGNIYIFIFISMVIAAIDAIATYNILLEKIALNLNFSIIAFVVYPILAVFQIFALIIYRENNETSLTKQKYKFTLGSKLLAIILYWLAEIFTILVLFLFLAFTDQSILTIKSADLSMFILAMIYIIPALGIILKLLNSSENIKIYIITATFFGSSSD